MEKTLKRVVMEKTLKRFNNYAADWLSNTACI